MCLSAQFINAEIFPLHEYACVVLLIMGIILKNLPECKQAHTGIPDTPDTWCDADSNL